MATPGGEQQDRSSRQQRGAGSRRATSPSTMRPTWRGIQTISSAMPSSITADAA